MMAAKKVPLVKQCRDEDSPMFGAVAVKGDGDRWGVMHPSNGGHWSPAEDVEDWSVLS